MTVLPELSIIIPAHNEEAEVTGCLRAVLAADGPNVAEVIVVANGCTDATATRARNMGEALEARGWSLQVLDLAQGSKPGALNAGDAAACSGNRVYLDADVRISPGLLPQLVGKLSEDGAVYSSGTLRLSSATTYATRAYARIYAQVPFLTQGVPGAGLFALNAAARARWEDWPDIISDDTFARLNFTPGERQKVSATYDWPLVEGWRALVRVRRRQNKGVAEIAALYPKLVGNDDKRGLSFGSLLQLALRDPVGFCVYTSVSLATKFGQSVSWERGR